MLPEGERSYGFPRLTPVLIGQMFGQPQRTLMYDDTRIYVWPYNIMKATLPSVEISGRTRHSTGRLEHTPLGSVMHSRRGERGLLLYGQERPLRKGRYRVRFLMLLEGGPGGETARIEVQKARAREFKPETIAARTLSAGEKPGWREYFLDFTVGEPPRGHLNYEFRVFATGAGEVTVKSVTLESL
jgi:hypothetical protein